MEKVVEVKNGSEYAVGQGGTRMATRKKEQSFLVVDGDIQLRVVVDPDSGWLCASSINVRGLNTQARTMPELLVNARDAAQALREYDVKLAKELASGKIKPSKVSSRRAVACAVDA